MSKTNVIYELEYKYSDEDEYHFANALVYDTRTELGKKIEQLDEWASEDGDKIADLDKFLYDLYGIDDSQICFYKDEADLVWNLKEDFERSFDIDIKNMSVVIEPDVKKGE